MSVLFPEPTMQQDPRALLLSDILYVHTAHGIPQWVTWCALVHVVLSTEESEMGKPNFLFPEIPVVNGGGETDNETNRCTISEWRPIWRDCQDMQPNQGDPRAVLAG